MEEKESILLRFLYHTWMGRVFLKFLASRTVSKICGRFLDSRISKILIPGFIRKNDIPIHDYYHDDFQCFNDCFTRKIHEECRKIDGNVNHLIAPCDGLLSAYEIKDGLVIPIKQSQYSIESLLENEQLSKRYQNGICLVFRLCVNHYHRYCYLDSGKKKKNVFLPGKLHTVRPIALESVPVFLENCREYTEMETNHFGVVTQVEVGALLVGKIQNHHEKYEFLKGEEKGMFLYGGSTIVVLLEKDKVRISKDYFEATKQGKEVSVCMGQKIGEKTN